MSVSEPKDKVEMSTAVAPESREKTLNRLKGSRVALESFLERYSDSQSTRIDALEGIEWLDRIVGEATLGNFDNSEIERWMSQHRELAQSTTLSIQDRKRIAALLLELQSKSDSSDTEAPAEETTPAETDGAAALRQRFATWKERSGSVGVSSVESRLNVTESTLPITESVTTSAASLSSVSEKTSSRKNTSHKNTSQKIILRRRSENAEIGLFERVTEQVWAELDLLYQEFETSEHALTKLDQLLKLAESKTDPMYLHLAGSLIYFLKIEGFRMAPYAERLRKAEKRFSGSRNPNTV